LSACSTTLSSSFEKSSNDAAPVVEYSATTNEEKTSSVEAPTSITEEPSISKEELTAKNDYDWIVHKLDFQEPNTHQYDGLAFARVSVLDNNVYLGNTDHFIQYISLINNELITRHLPELDVGKFHSVNIDGYIFTKSLYDRNMTLIDRGDATKLSPQPINLYDSQMNLIRRVNGPTFYENIPSNIEYEGNNIFDVSNDLHQFLYAEQYTVIDSSGFSSVANGLFLYNTSSGVSEKVLSDSVFYYAVEFLPDENYALLSYINDDKVVCSAILDISNKYVQTLEQSENGQPNLLLDCRNYYIFSNGYYDKQNLSYHLRPSFVPINIPYAIDDTGSCFVYLVNNRPVLKP
jgi:hypothetical protein